MYREHSIKLNEDTAQQTFNFEPVASPPLMSPAEIYERASQSLLTQIKEDRRIERKPVGIHSKELGEYFSMWANTAPDGGLIAIGVSDDGAVSGCVRQAIEHINRLERTGDIFCPECFAEMKRVRVTRADGVDDYILLVYVHYKRTGRVARTSNGEAFIRLGDTKKRLTEDEIRELEIDRKQIDFEMDPTDFQYPSDFVSNLVQQYIKAFRESRDLSTDVSDNDILEMRHLGKQNGSRFVPNVACTLAFAKDPQRLFPGSKIRFLRFEGETEGSGQRWNPIKDVSIDQGPIPIQIQQAAQVIESQIRTFTRLGEDNKFYTASEYPKTAWYEALVNACVHRSYSLRNMNVFVRMFDDHLEIESPGAFPPMVTPQNIYYVQQARNPFLMDVMFYLEFVRAAREGARRIRDSMKAMELPNPEFSEKSDDYPIVRVILRNNYKQRKVLLDSDAISVVGEVMYKTLSSEEIRAINYATEHGSVNVSELMRLIQRSWHHSKMILETLKKRGILEDKRHSKLRGDPHARYFLKAPKKPLPAR